MRLPAFRSGVCAALLLILAQAAALGQTKSAVKLPPIEPCPLDADRVQREFPAPITSIVLGGGGRYLCLHLPSKAQIAVFDVNTGQVTGYIPAADEQVLFAAGAEKLALLMGAKKVLSRWNLATCEREQVANVDLTDVTCMAMGSASNGPLLMWPKQGNGKATFTADAIKFIDLQTLAPLKIALAHKDPIRNDYANDPFLARPSANGQVFAVFANRCLILRLTGTRGQILTNDVVNSTYLSPSADGDCSSSGSARTRSSTATNTTRWATWRRRLTAACCLRERGCSGSI